MRVSLGQVNLAMSGDKYICPVHFWNAYICTAMAALCQTVGLKAVSGINASKGGCSGCAYDIGAVYIAAQLGGYVWGFGMQLLAVVPIRVFVCQRFVSVLATVKVPVEHVGWQS